MKATWFSVGVYHALKQCNLFVHLQFAAFENLTQILTLSWGIREWGRPGRCTLG